MDQNTQAMALDAIKKIGEALETLKYLVTADKKVDNKSKPPKTDKIKPRYATATAVATPLLGEAPIHTDEAWPMAVPRHMIVNTGDVKVKQYRAAQIASIMNLPIGNAKVLDYGCGDGYVSRELAKSAASVVGFDIKADASWANASNLTLTQDIEVAKSGGPYDVVLLYDVVDHLEGTDPDSLFKFIESVLSESGKGFVRFHPWTSKHGGHLYDKVNKAFVHLVYTPDELASLGYTLDHNLKITRPMAAYDSFFEKNGLEIINRKVQSERVEEYVGESLMSRIKKVTWNGAIETDVALKIMGIQFVDYTFKRKTAS